MTIVKTASFLDFNAKLCEVLGLPADRVVTLSILTTGDDCTVWVEMLPEFDQDSLDSWTHKYKIVEIGDPVWNDPNMSDVPDTEETEADEVDADEADETEETDEDE